MENKSIEGNIYTNNKTGILHLVVKDNFKDHILGDKKNNIILRSLDKLNLNSQSYFIIDVDSFNEDYSFLMSYDEWKKTIDDITNDFLNDSSVLESLELKKKHLNEREKILKEKITNIMNIMHEWSIELDELFPEYTYEN